MMSKKTTLVFGNTMVPTISLFNVVSVMTKSILAHQFFHKQMADSGRRFHLDDCIANTQQKTASGECCALLLVSALFIC